MKRLLTLAVLTLLPILAFSSTVQYVSDKLVITLRTGQGNNYPILRTVETGDRLDVIQTTDTGYSRVRTQDGTEGWVRSQYLMDTPAAQTRLEQVNRQLEQLRSQTANLRETFSTLQKERAELAAERDQLLKQAQDAEAQLTHLSEVAGRPVQIDQENRELQQKNVALERELQLLMQETQLLRDRSQREWFIAGAGVLLAGLFLGLLLPKLKLQKRSSW